MDTIFQPSLLVVVLGRSKTDISRRVKNPLVVDHLKDNCNIDYLHIRMTYYGANSSTLEDGDQRRLQNKLLNKVEKKSQEERKV